MHRVSKLQAVPEVSIALENRRVKAVAEAWRQLTYMPEVSLRALPNYLGTCTVVIANGLTLQISSSLLAISALYLLLNLSGTLLGSKA